MSASLYSLTADIGLHLARPSTPQTIERAVFADTSAPPRPCCTVAQLSTTFTSLALFQEAARRYFETGLFCLRYAHHWSLTQTVPAQTISTARAQWSISPSQSQSVRPSVRPSVSQSPDSSTLGISLLPSDSLASLITCTPSIPSLFTPARTHGRARAVHVCAAQHNLTDQQSFVLTDCCPIDVRACLCHCAPPLRARLPAEGTKKQASVSARTLTATSLPSYPLPSPPLPPVQPDLLNRA